MASPEQDCWGCGRPASDFFRRASAVQFLAAPLGPAREGGPPGRG